MARPSRAALVAVLASALAAPAARAADSSVPGDFPTIQAAIDAAGDDDTIHVAAGNWPGALVVAGKHVSLQGAGAELTVIDGLGAAAVLSVEGLETSVSLADLALTGGTTGVATGTTAFAILERCTVRDNAGPGGSGRIMAYDSAFTGNSSHGLDTFDLVSGCTFQGNGGWGAQDVDSTISGPPVTGSRFLGNGLGGLRLAVSSPTSLFPAELHVSRCVFVGDNLQLSTFEFQGIGESFVDHVTLLGGTIKLMQGTLLVRNSILRSDAPITDLADPGAPVVTWSDLPGTWFPGTGNIDADPLWADAEGGDFTLLAGSPCINTGDPADLHDPDGSPVDMGATTWHPWTDLGGAIAFADGRADLAGGGPLIAGQAVSLGLVSGPAGTGVWLPLSAVELGVPFKGGTLWPGPGVVLGPLPTSATGELDVAGQWPLHLPDGFSFVAQVLWPDASAVQGWAASNGLRGVQP